MRVFGLVCLAAMQLFPGVCGGPPLRCSRGSSSCADGSSCFLDSHQCDGETDCSDGSDEENCAVNCTEGQFQCAHRRRCIEGGQVCDGESQCQDDSDELRCPSPGDGCVHFCDNRNRCLPPTFLCDGAKDCLDGTDEDHCEEQDKTEQPVPVLPSVPVLPLVPLHCSLVAKPCKDNSECVLHAHVCDGEQDCKDGSDEEDCQLQCSTGQFHCARGPLCLPPSQVCDGLAQCQDGSDERDCSPQDGCSHQCDGGRRCVPPTFLCDGERDCQDGTDEDHCESEACGEGQFRCRSGQCVALPLRCDGRSDCTDRSDEDRCPTPPTCPPQHHCPNSSKCLLPEWLCDGDQDCEGGTDEQNCAVKPVTCGDFQWRCKSKTMCVPKSWRCDGTRDCEDGSDETECAVVDCPSPQFRCLGGGCLEPGAVCDRVRDCEDGSDEGEGCGLQCTDHNCSHTCLSTPQGPRCSCPAGQRLLLDARTCAHVDECGAQRECSQLCRNSPGSFTCHCLPGFVLEADGHSCKSTVEPLLVVSVSKDLVVVGLRSGSLDLLPASPKKVILSLDYDWSQRRVYWGSLDSSSIKWSALDYRATGTLIKGVRADAVAVDWLGRNVYWIDGVKSQILAVQLPEASGTIPDYTVILDQDLDQPRSLALLPQKGWMFWTEVGSTVKIERSGMDGSERKALVTSHLGWPVGVAADAVSNRVYWTDQRLKAIGSATLEGEDIQILQMGTDNPFAIAVFNDVLYWSDTRRRAVQGAHRGTGKSRRVLLKRPQQPFGLKVMHPLLQSSTERPCEAPGCSHLCVLAPGPRPVCRCPFGLLLSQDQRSCSRPDTAFLLLLAPAALTQVFLPSRFPAPGLKDWPEHSSIQLPHINQAAILDYSFKDQALYVTDDSTASLSALTLADGGLSAPRHLLRLLHDRITALALDWSSGNVFWSSSEQPRIHVTSTGTGRSAVLLADGLGAVHAIALHPQSGRLCFTSTGEPRGETGEKGETVECADMDGGRRSVVWKDAVTPRTLVFSSDGKVLFWADNGLGAVGSVRLDLLSYTELKVGDGLTAVTLYDETLLWMTTGEKTRVWYQDQQQQNQMWFEVSTKLVGFKVFSSSHQKGSTRCSSDNGGCSHLCLPTGEGRSCGCDFDHAPLNSTHCLPRQHCGSRSRPCWDLLSCLPLSKFCDGHADCADRSDENCLTLNSLSDLADSLDLLTSPPSGEASARPTNDSEGSWEMGPLELGLEECSERHCSSRGRCVEVEGQTQCVCPLLYSGPSCENGLLTSLRWPLVYGAAGLLVLLLLIMVVVLVCKRRRATQARSDAPGVCATSLKELDGKAEPGPCAPSSQTSPSSPSSQTSQTSPSSQTSQTSPSSQTSQTSPSSQTSQTSPAQAEKPEEVVRLTEIREKTHFK